MLAHLLYSFVTEEYPQVFYQNLSKKSQGSLFVSLFNFQGPLPLKERAFCILPHHRRFVNTFFSACPGFLPPHRFFLLAFLFQGCALPALFALPFGSPLEECLIILSNHSPFVNIFFLLFLPLFTPPRALRERQENARG